jgi:hypothetical protein
VFPPGLFSSRSLNLPLDRRGYVTAGLALMALKYAVDAIAIYAVTGIVWTPADYLLPLLSIVGDKMAQFPAWLNLVLLLWTAPFVWIGVTLSVRRAISAAVSPWWVVAFFLPVLNYVFMLVLALLPERILAPRGATREAAGAIAPAATAWSRSVVAGIGAGALTGVVLIVLGVLGMRTYGVALFMATPFVIGATAAYVFRRMHAASMGASVSVGLTAAMILGLGLLSLALEGLVCLLMAAPLAVPIVAVGAMVGHRLAEPRAAPAIGLGLVLLIVPVGNGMDALLDRPPERVVLTTIEIDAPPERVWPYVIAFDEITGAPDWYFRFGLAYPLRARIVGEGAGAVRFCEFTTGAFREPITAWEAPYRLAFDVAEQPPPLQEWSPWSRVIAPHQQGYFRTTRGEFRLIPLANGRTRLEGRTWYSLRVYPVAYWMSISDRIIHDIHLRVLQHIERRATRDGTEAR